MTATNAICPVMAALGPLRVEKPGLGSARSSGNARLCVCMWYVSVHPEERHTELTPHKNMLNTLAFCPPFLPAVPLAGFRGLCLLGSCVSQILTFSPLPGQGKEEIW